MRIVFVGTGYVGLVAGTCLAEVGNAVTCVDVDESRIQKLRKGEAPLYEPGLEQKIRENLESMIRKHSGPSRQKASPGLSRLPKPWNGICPTPSGLRGAN